MIQTIIKIVAICRVAISCRTKRTQQMTTVLQTNVSYDATRESVDCKYFIIPIFLVLNNDELNASGGGNSSSSKLGMHIKSEDPSDPLGDGPLNQGNFGNMNPQQPGSNRPSMIPQTSPERIQPLPSNIINKQSNSMDVSHS
jgi:hypothetical protein